jgi:biotin transport system substrate-specific component
VQIANNEDNHMKPENTKTLSLALWPSTQNSALLRNIVWAFIGTMLLAISAKVKVPLEPVPISMQSYVVLVLGASFGWRLGIATIALYLFEGLVLGLPVFAGETAGLTYVAFPNRGFYTIGYLVSYLVAAGVVGFLAERGFDRTPVKALIMMSIGTALILAIGAGWLSYIIGTEKAIMTGVMPFLYGDAIKVALAAATLPIAWKILRK